MLRDLVMTNRSYRRFDESKAIDAQTLRDLVDLARFSATGGNAQTIKFLPSCTPETNDRIFPLLRWAAILKDWSGPADSERPSGYVVIVGDNHLASNFGCNHAIAAQSILLGAVEKGLGGCMIGNFPAGELREALGLSDRYTPLLVIALGTPAETVVLEDMPADGSTAYWRTADGAHHVPKRSIEDLILAPGGSDS